MHKLLQQVATLAVQRQEPWKRQILVDAHEISDILETDSGSRSVVGISCDISKILDDVFISARAFKRMRNLRFLSIYKTRSDTNYRVHVPENMEFPPRLRLLHWEVYPRKCLPHTFSPEYLVDLNLQQNQLEKLWEGTQFLVNLKKMDLSESSNLKEVPDLSNATNLEELILTHCESLVELPSSIGNLRKLEVLQLDFCIKLQVVPSVLNLASLESVCMMGCLQLRKIPDIPRNITFVGIADTMLEEVPDSIKLWSRLHTLCIFGSVEPLPKVPEKFRKRSGAEIEKIPDCIKDLPRLRWLYIGGCPKLASLPELPASLISLTANTCESLEAISVSCDSQIEILYFPNCFILGLEAQRVITQHPLAAILPGKKIPPEFNHRAKGNSLTTRSDFYGFRFCVVGSPKQEMEEGAELLCHIRLNGCHIDKSIIRHIYMIQGEHLFIFYSELPDKDGWLELDNEVMFEFSFTSQDIDIIECGVQILTEKTNKSISRFGRVGLGLEKFDGNSDI